LVLDVSCGSESTPIVCNLQARISS
jgi:hypothetical protein